MANLKQNIGRKAAKATFRHSVNGFVSKSKRQPLRSATLLGVGGLVGGTAGWMAGRKTGQSAS